MARQPGDITLHECNGEARLYASPKVIAHAYCHECRGPVAPEQPYVKGHAGCGAGLLAAVLDDAEHVIGGR